MPKSVEKYQNDVFDILNTLTSSSFISEDHSIFSYESLSQYAEDFFELEV